MFAKRSRHRSLFSLPRDFAHRRRFRRKLINFIGIPLLSLFVAYVLTRPTGGAGVALPRKLEAEGRIAAKGPASAKDGANLASGASVANGVSTSDGLKAIAEPPMMNGAYMLDIGPEAVTQVPDVMLHDARRNTDVHVKIFYPEEQGVYPVIVISPGGSSSETCCDTLTRHWASYGYITLQASSDESAAENGEAQPANPRAQKKISTAAQDPSQVLDRAKDISFVLDSLGLLAKRVPALQGQLDVENMGVGGVGSGAGAAQALAGAFLDLPNKPHASLADPRVRAVLLLSPPGPGEFGFGAHSWDRVTLPVLSVTGSLDLGAQKQSPDWREIPYQKSLPGNKFQLFVQGADSASLYSGKSPATGHPGSGAAILGFTDSASLAFWDAYLKTDPRAKLYLLSDGLPDFSQGRVQLLRR
ncbi:MAG TPA: hypothetical protein VJN93_02805 [Candidatus Acidoferrum sp.]|nr:hypothetical protein [Candidatus Acidoferrum sp.]